MGNDETVINQVGNRYSRAHNLIPATALSRVGSIAYTVVVAWYVSQHAGNQMVGLMNALNGAGVLLASILGFTIIDRYNKKTLLIAYDIINSIFCIVATVLSIYLDRHASVFIVLILSAWLSLIATIYAPTSRAIIPEILHAQEFEKYNSVYSVVGELSRSAGPLVGAAILAQQTADALEAALIVNFVSFMLSLVITLYLPSGRRVSRAEVKEEKPRITRDLSDGLAYIASSAYLRREVLYITVINVWGASTLYLLLGRVAHLGMDSNMYGLGMFISALGAVAASATIHKTPSLGAKAHPNTLLFLMCCAYCIAIIPGIISVFCALFISAGIIVIYNIRLYSDVQKNSTPKHIGKVMSVIFLATALFTALGSLLFSHVSVCADTGLYAIVCAASLIAVTAGLTLTKWTRRTT